jgi:N-acetylmuramoyl-L-alanine amidase
MEVERYTYFKILVLLFALSIFCCSYSHKYKFDKIQKERLDKISQKYSEKISSSALKDRLEILEPFYGRTSQDKKRPFFRDIVEIDEEYLTIFKSAEKNIPLARIDLKMAPLWLDQRKADFSKFCSIFNNPSSKKLFKNVKIAIDPGHVGGKYCERDERTYFYGGKSVCEGNINLETSLKLKDLLEYKGSEVILTREENSPLISNFSRQEKDYKKFLKEEYQARIKLINDFDPNITLLIHHNMGNEPVPYDGINIFVPGAFYRGEIGNSDELLDFLDILFSSHNAFIKTRAFQRVFSLGRPSDSEKPERLKSQLNRCPF